MEVLELADKHAVMLLQMCKEYLCDNLYKDCCISSDKQFVIFVGGGEHLEIPWLEVCMLHLPKALATPNNRAWDMSIRQAYNLQKFYHHPRHVVEYLYDEFKDKTIWNKKTKL